MSDGFDSSVPVGGQSLGGFIASKATQSIKAAIKQDKKSSKKEEKKSNKKQKTNKKDKQKKSSGVLGGALSSITNAFNPSKGKPEEVKQTKPRTSGGATGLAKILTQGFGSLTADTLGLAGGLASITQLLNQQLKAQSFTATGVQTISAILSDQLENQSSIVSGVKSLKPGGGAGKVGKGMFGSSKSASTDTLSGFIADQIKRRLEGAGISLGLGAALKFPLTIPAVITALSAVKLSSDSERASQRAIDEAQSKETKPLTNAEKEQAVRDKMTNPLMGGPLIPTLVEQQLNNPVNKSGGAINIFNRSTKKYSSGVINKYSIGGMNTYAAGGSPSMIGEAGKEAVVDLNSRQSRKMLSGSSQSTGDAGMKASGAATLAIVDQFIKGMGPLGAPVAQALGPDISNLARTFDMSQVLPNLKIGGGKFKEDGNGKKTRDKFLEDLISGSLESLGAKKKEDKKGGSPTKPPQTTKEQQTQSRPDNPATGSATQVKKGADGKPMDTHDPKAYGAERQSAVTGTAEGIGVSDVDTNRQTGELEANHVEFDYNGARYKVRINPNNGDYAVFKKGNITTGFIDQKVDIGGPNGPKKGQANEAILKLAHGQVRAFFSNNAPDKGLSLGYLTEDESKKARNKLKNIRSNKLVNGDQEIGGKVKPAYDKGGSAVQRPWWDFLGKFIDTHRNTKQSDYSMSASQGNPLAGMARQREMMKQMGYNYEEGGTAKAPTITEDVNDIRRMIAASMMRQQGRDLPGGKIPVGDDLKPKSVRPSTAPVGATNQIDSSMESAAIINVISGGGSSPQIPVNEESMETSAAYMSDPWPSGMAGVLCSSPWGVYQ